MFSVGDVIELWSIEAGKPKYHLCISLDGHYLFVNSPKFRTYPGDMVVSCTEFPFLDPTPSGQSIISCTLLMKKTDAELRACRAKKRGAVRKDLLSQLIKFVMNCPVLTQDERDYIIDAAGDWA
jgi:hypothetical protein